MYSGIGYPVDVDGFFKASNLHNLLMIPFFISMIYCYKVSQSQTNQKWKSGRIWQELGFILQITKN